MEVFFRLRSGCDPMIYLDYAATTPIDAEALNIWVEASQQFFGNSSSLHDFGSKAARFT